MAPNRGENLQCCFIHFYSNGFYVQMLNFNTDHLIVIKWIENGK